MRSKALQRLSFFMAFWLMVVSVGASIDVHFCNGKIYSLGLNAQADKCAGFYSERQVDSRESFRKSPCCDQFSGHFQSDLDDRAVEMNTEHSMSSVLILHHHPIDLVNGGEPIQLCRYYTPPEREKDVLSLYSVFII